MAEAKSIDFSSYAAAMAQALDLPLLAGYAPQVEANLSTAFQMAQLFVDFPLPDEAEPAPVFAAAGAQP